MATVNWLGVTAQQEGANGAYLVYRWDISNNWSSGAAPGAGADVAISAGTPGPVLQTSTHVNALTLDSDQNLTLGAPLDAIAASYGAGRLEITTALTLDG